MTSRRRFLRSALEGMAGLAIAPRLLASAEPAPKELRPRIGLQLYAVRGSFSRDVPGTLSGVARLGYEGVEFWGYGGTKNVFQQHSAKELRRLLDERRLRCCGMHVQLAALEPERLETTIEANRVLRNPYLIVAAAREHMQSAESIRRFATLLTRAAKAVRPHEMRVGYHAHGFDFARIGGKFAWDMLFEQLGPEVVMQMDVGNCLGGGGDPLASLARFPGRATTIHLKEHGDKTFSSSYFEKVFALCRKTPPTRWFIVEMGGDGGNGLEIPGKAISDLRAALGRGDAPKASP